MARGNGTHKLAVKRDLLDPLGKDVGDEVTIHLDERTIRLRSDAAELVSAGEIRGLARSALTSTS